MKRFILSLLVLPSVPLAAQQSPQTTAWALDSSSLTYHMSHPIHEVDGTSHAAKGKGICSGNRCEFLVAAPVKSFDSGDTNRDLHMLQVVRGAQHPFVTVRLSVPESELNAPALTADLDIEFAGQKVHYNQVLIHNTVKENSHQISGVVPSALTDFRIEAPSFLMVPIKNEIPVRFELNWHQVDTPDSRPPNSPVKQSGGSKQ